MKKFFLAVLVVLALAFAAEAGSLNYLVIIEGKYGQAAIGFQAPGYIDNRVLAANTAESLTVPTGAKYLLSSCTGDFWQAYNTAASVPGGDITGGGASELNPTLRGINGVSTVSWMSAASNKCSFSFFK